MTLGITKQANGKYTFAGILSNNVIDKHGETFSKASHEDYVRRFDSGLVRKPLLLYWHEPIPMGLIKEVWVERGFLAVAGEFFEPFNPVARALSASDETWGMSLGIPSGEYERDEMDDSVFKSYTLIEGSILPGNRVANSLTGFSALTKGYSMKLSQEKRQRLEKLVGPDQVGELMKTVDDYLLAVEKEGMPTKSEGSAVAKDVEATDEVATEEVEAEAEVDAEDTTDEAEVETEADIAVDEPAYITQSQLAETVQELVKAFRTEITKQFDGFKAEQRTVKKSMRHEPFTASAMIAKAFADDSHQEDIVKEGDALSEAMPKVNKKTESTGNIYLDAIASSFAITGEN